MAEYGRKFTQEGLGRLLRGKHFWTGIFVCTVLLSATVSTTASTGVAGPPRILKLVYKDARRANEEAEEALGTDGEELEYPPDNEASDFPEFETEGEILEDDELPYSDTEDAFVGTLKHQFSLEEYAKEPDVLGTILAVGRRANPNLDNSNETIASAGEFEKIRSSSWEAPAYSVVTDEDLENNVVVERVLRPSDTFSLQFPRKLTTSPRNLYAYAHPVVAGECDTSRTVPYTAIFPGAPPSHELWTTYPESRGSSNLVFSAPADDVLRKSGKNAQFCFTVSDPEKTGTVTLWVQVRVSDLFTDCAGGSCQEQEGSEETQ